MPNTINSNFRLHLLDALDAETTLGCSSLPGSGAWGVVASGGHLEPMAALPDIIYLLISISLW